MPTPRRRQLLGIILAGFFPTVVSAVSSAADRDPTHSVNAPRRVVEDFTAAWNAHRIDSLVQLFTPNGSLATPSGGVARSRSAIRELLADQHEHVFRQSSLSTRVEGVHRQGAHRAIITGAFTLDGIPAILGVEVSRQGSFRFELTRRDGEWLISSARIQPA